MKRNVYIAQFNTSTRILLPLAAGQIYSTAKNDEKISKRYNLHLRVLRDTPEKVIEQYENPAVLAYSNYVWNFNYNLKIASLAKKKFPNAIIVFGGPQVSIEINEAKKIFEKYPFIDVIVQGPGEIVFRELLHSLSQNGLLKINNKKILSFKIDGKMLFKSENTAIQEFINLPSPFLDGTFDSLMKSYKDIFTGVIWESNRGCPYSCSYCYWGSSKILLHKFTEDRIYAELDWIARNKINYIFIADANFGIFKRDLKIAEYLAQLNQKIGYPKYLAMSWAKNIPQAVFDIISILKKSNIEFMVTMSFQSFNPETIAAINRKNIKSEHLYHILNRALQQNFHVYSELILALPMETYHSFVEGIRKVMLPNLNYHFTVYPCSVLPGTEMSTKEYIDKYNIRIARTNLNIAKAITIDQGIPENEDIIISTSTMSINNWKKAYIFALFSKCIYGFRLAFFILNYLREKHNVDLVELIENIIERAQYDNHDILHNVLKILNDSADSIIQNNKSLIKLECVETDLSPDMASLVVCLSEKHSFYQDVDRYIKAFLSDKKIKLNEEEYEEVLSYQNNIIPTWIDEGIRILKFKTDYIFTLINYKENNTPATILFQNKNKYSSIDHFLRIHIYGSIVFKLLEPSTTH